MTEENKHLQILLVEDNPVDVLMTRQALQDWELKNRLHVVTNGNEALDFLYKQGDYVGSSRPDLVLLDLNIPQKSGKEVLTAIKRDPDLENITVVVATTSDSPNDRQTCHELGADLFITKPLDLDAYIGAINSIQDFWFVSSSALKGLE
jgi:CheY-like chemotaxis protein